MGNCINLKIIDKAVRGAPKTDSNAVLNFVPYEQISSTTLGAPTYVMK